MVTRRRSASATVPLKRPQEVERLRRLARGEKSRILPRGVTQRPKSGLPEGFMPEEVPAWALREYSATMTTAEYAVLEALLQMGKQHRVHFLYQAPELRGTYENEFGYTIVDFLLVDTDPYIAVPVNGTYWHYLRGSGIIESDLEKLRRLRNERGYDVVVIDEDDIRALGAAPLLRLAYQRVDLSRLAGRI